jgi:hypothetical protein
MTGTITDVIDHGTIVQVIFAAEGRLVSIYFDHRPFCWLLGGECCGPAELIGRRVQYNGVTVGFLD